MDIYRRLLETYVKPYLGTVVIALLFAVFTAGLTALSMYLLKPAFDFIFAYKGKDTTMAMNYLKILPLAIILTYALKGACSFAQNYLINWVGSKIILDMRNRLYTHVTGLSMKFFNNNKIGVLISRITNDVQQIQGAIANVFGNVIGAVLNSIGLISLLFVLQWKFALMSMVVFPVAILPIVAFGKRLKKASRGAQEKMGDITAVLTESFNGIRVVKAFGMENYERRRFLSDLERFFYYNMKGVKAYVLSSPVMETIGAVGIAALIYVAGSAVINEQMTTGTFFAFIGALTGLYPQIKKLNDTNSVIQQALAAAERVFLVLDTEPDVIDVADPVEMTQFSKQIEFIKTRFAYTEGIEVIKNVSFKINKGEVFAVVGPSGGGKSTLADLLARFYDPTDGSIEIDGIDLKKIKISALRELVGMVTQETILFNDTIRNNIAYGHDDIDEAKIIEAAKAANAHQFISEITEGYDSLIGDRGVKLSGGQRQRLAIARAILKNPPILILDEATSALDSESELLVQEAINNLMKNRTTFVIAHRLSTVRNADNIIVVERGEIVERGKHGELLAKGGLYTKLHNMQFKLQDGGN